MKPVLKIVVFVLLMGEIVFISCNKYSPDNPSSYPSTPPPLPTPPGKTIKGKVVEYGTNLPIADATLSVCTSLLGNGNCGGYKSFTTDAFGEIVFTADKFQINQVVKEGYCDFGSGELKAFFLADSLLRGYFYTADSFIVAKIPKTNITIHIINSITVPDYDVSLYLYGSFGDHQWSTSFGVGQGEVGAIRLHPGIDTTFQYTVYGNADNTFIVATNATEGWYDGVLLSELRHIPNVSNFTLNITY